MSEIQPSSWLAWHGGYRAQSAAVRLSASCCAVLPSDRNFQKLHEEQILSDTLELAIHGRRTMEQYRLKPSVMSHGPLWPSSRVPVPTGQSLWDIFAKIIHALKITVDWEALEEFSTEPYRGRSAVFAGSISLESDRSRLSVPLGAMAASYLTIFQSQIGSEANLSGFENA